MLSLPICGCVPDTPVDEVRPVVVDLLASGVFHADLHELLEGGVVPVVPVSQLVHEGLGLLGYFRHA